MQSRRDFLGAAALAAGAAAISNAAPRPTKDDISLAAWTFSRSYFRDHRWKNLDLPRIVREELNINGIEFVNQFFENPMLDYLKQLKRNGDAYGVKFVLIMVDDEGNMGAVDRNERMQAAVLHRKWVDIAHFLGCHAIRCNVRGARQDWKNDKDFVNRAAESFGDLLQYARGSNLNIIIENHGGASSDPDILASLMKTVDSPNFGTLPDFGNVNPGDDRYEAMRKLAPYAKGVSVKASWAKDGTHPGYDLEKIIKIFQDAGYHGFWGIESNYGRSQQGKWEEQLTPDQVWANEVKGALLTKAILERTVLKKG
jgi:L-ribulose-5-phosphate 3-epimerase